MGRLHVVLVEGEGKRPGTFTGRTDSNKRVVFPASLLLKGIRADEAAALARAKQSDVDAVLAELRSARQGGGQGQGVEKGIYVVVKVTGARGHTLRGVPLATTTIAESHPLNLPALSTD